MGRVPITVMGYRCERCAHEWIPRGDHDGDPKQCPGCKSALWETPKRTSSMTSYESFRDEIREALKGGALTWTEIRTTAKLPQMFPNNQWVRRLEDDIALQRLKDAHGIIHWSLKNGSTEQAEPTKRPAAKAGRKQGRVE